MKKIIPTLATALVGIVLATGCGSSGAGTRPHTYTVADCKDRLTRDYKHAVADPNWAGRTTRPKECVGVSNKELNKIVTQILSDQFNN